VPIGRLLTGAAIAVAAVYLAVLVASPDAVFAFTFDDAFYYFGIARNLAEGHGSTWDGLQHTNGYHPLWMLVCVPPFLAGLDGMAAARVLVGVQLLLWATAMVLVARRAGALIGDLPGVRDPMARRWAVFGVVTAFVLVAGNPFVVRTFVNGLESGVVVLVGALILDRALDGDGRWLADGVEPRRRLIMGMLLVAAFLARTDAVLLAGCLGVWCLAEARGPLARVLGRLAELFAPVTVITAVFLAVNLAVFDTAVQISGVVKRAELTLPRVVGMALVVALALLLGAAGWRRSHRDPARLAPTRFPRVAALGARTAWYGAFGVLLVGYYSFLQVQQWLWYYAPLVLWLLLLATLGVADFVEAAVAEAPAGRSPTRALAPVLAILVVPLLAAFAWMARAFADPDLRSIQLANRDAGEWIDAELPDDAVLASWDAGVVGYFADRPTVNLDGVVASMAFVEARDDGRLGGFLDGLGVGWLVNHGEVVDGADPDVLAFVDAVFGEQVAADTTLVRDWPFTFSGVTVGAGFQGAASGPQAVFLYRLP
jgi:hypothetical protein